MNKNNNKMDLLGNAPVPQALMALGIPIIIIKHTITNLFFIFKA